MLLMHSSAPVYWTPRRVVNRPTWYTWLCLTLSIIHVHLSGCSNETAPATTRRTGLLDNLIVSSVFRSCSVMVFVQLRAAKEAKDKAEEERKAMESKLALLSVCRYCGVSPGSAFRFVNWVLFLHCTSRLCGPVHWNCPSVL